MLLVNAISCSTLPATPKQAPHMSMQCALGHFPSIEEQEQGAPALTIDDNVVVSCAWQKGRSANEAYL